MAIKIDTLNRFLDVATFYESKLRADNRVQMVQKIINMTPEEQSTLFGSLDTIHNFAKALREESLSLTAPRVKR